MFIMKRVVFLGLIPLFSIMYLAGCGATITGTQTETSYKLQRSLTAPVYWEVHVAKTPKKIYNAALMGAKDLGLTVTQKNADQLSGILNGYFADGTQFRLKIEHESPGISMLRITAGKTGDKTLVLQIFNAIERHL